MCASQYGDMIWVDELSSLGYGFVVMLLNALIFHLKQEQHQHFIVPSDVHKLNLQ